MGVVVLNRGSSLTVCAEVRVVADCALESVTTNVVLATFDSAQWAIAVNAKMSLWAWAGESERLVERGEAVAWVNLCGTEMAGRAIVPVRAIQTLMSDADNRLKDVLA
jgi:hypothetical protein